MPSHFCWKSGWCYFSKYIQTNPLRNMACQVLGVVRVVLLVVNVRHILEDALVWLMSLPCVFNNLAFVCWTILFYLWPYILYCGFHCFHCFVQFCRFSLLLCFGMLLLWHLLSYQVNHMVSTAKTYFSSVYSILYVHHISADWLSSIVAMPGMFSKIMWIVFLIYPRHFWGIIHTQSWARFIKLHVMWNHIDEASSLLNHFVSANWDMVSPCLFFYL